MSVVIIGAGQAAAQLIDSLRRRGYANAITLVGEEGLPYQRPPLSKKYLAGELSLDRLQLRQRAYFDEHRVELRLGCRATAIDRHAKCVRLDDGALLNYEHLILATGSHPRRLQMAGADLAGVHYLRSLSDADQLRTEVHVGKRAVIVGGGYIGLEVAARFAGGLGLSWGLAHGIRMHGRALGRCARWWCGIERRLGQRCADHRGRAQCGGAGFHGRLFLGKNARANRAAEKSLALLKGIPEAIAFGDDLIRAQRDNFRGFERSLGRIENRLLQVDAAIHGFVRIKKLDAHGLALDHFTAHQGHLLRVQKTREFLLFIVLRQKHAVHLAAIRQQRCRRQFAIARRQRGHRQREAGGQQKQKWDERAQGFGSANDRKS